MLQIIKQTFVVYKIKPLLKVCDPDAELVRKEKDAEEDKKHAPDHRNNIEVFTKFCDIVGCRTYTPGNYEERYLKPERKDRKKESSLANCCRCGGKRKNCSKDRTYTRGPAKSKCRSKTGKSNYGAGSKVRTSSSRTES